MFHITSTIRTSAALAAALFFGQLLSACSGATSALPGNSAVQSASQLTSTYGSAPTAQTSKHKGGVIPQMCNGCDRCPANYQYGTFWQEWTDTNPPTWAEFVGDYYYAELDGVWEDLACGTYTQVVECNPKSWANCPPRYPWWAQITALKAPISEEKASFAVNDPLSNEIHVVTSLSGKKGFQMLATLSTGDATPVAIAGDHYGSIYASVLTKGSSVQPAVEIFSPGATIPSTTLTDAAANGASPAGVTVDRRRDVFFAYDVTSGSSSTIQIDEFPKGINKPMPFATIPGSGGGALAVTTKGEIVATSPSEGMVYAFASTGKPIVKFAASGSPTSISLDRKDQNLYVTDSTNNAVSVYSFPSGALVHSSSFNDKEGDTLIPASMLPRDPQLP